MSVDVSALIAKINEQEKASAVPGAAAVLLPWEVLPDGISLNGLAHVRRLHSTGCRVLTVLPPAKTPFGITPRRYHSVNLDGRWIPLAPEYDLDVAKGFADLLVRVVGYRLQE